MLSDVTAVLTLRGVGILSKLRSREQRVTASTPGAITDPSTYPIASPWSSSDLNRIVAADVFGSDLPVNTRAAAMRLPALARARNLLVSTIARLPLQQLAGQTPASVQPSWINSAAGGTSPQLRLAWTVDDLLFYGWSCWWRENDASGFPASVMRLNQGDWSINDDNRVEVYGSVVNDDDVILFPGLHEGILSFGVDALDDTRTLYQIVRARLLNPVPQVDLHQTGGDPMTNDQIDQLIDRWAIARQGRNGGVGFTNKNIEARELGAGADSQLMIEARNAAAVDLARLVGVSASRVDASGVNSTLTYETTTGRNQELVDFDLALYMTPITARLSLDDVTPPTERVDFDLADFTAQAPSVNGPNFGD